MHNHLGVIDKIGEQYRPRCLCKRKGALVTHLWEAEDWVREHVESAERVKARNANREPSLKRSAAMYREAEQAAEREPDRALWAQMAQEIEDRINACHSNMEQIGLW